MTALALAAILLAADPFSLGDKTLVAWVRVSDVNSRGGSALTLGQGAHFDGLVFGEIEPARWMGGSENFRRTPKDQSRWPRETARPTQPIALALVMQATRAALYRDGEPIAEYDLAEAAPEYRLGSYVSFGLRHLGAGSPAHFAGAIDDARIYSKALTRAEIAGLKPNRPGGPVPFAWWDFETDATDRQGRFSEPELVGGARLEAGELLLDGVDDALVAYTATAGSTRVHFRPRRGNFADPIPFFWKGDYHVFYLQGGVGKVPWRHIASRDLVEWRELPTALTSDGPADGPDGEHQFTGSVLESEGTFHLFYTGWNPRNPRGREFILHATSDDLVRWTKRPADGFTADGAIYAARQDSDFRDPFVFWNPEDGQWWMLLCARAASDNRPVTGVYASRDLVKWTPRPPLCDGYKNTPECPDLFRIGDDWFLIVSPSEGVTTYRTARSLAGPWSPAPGVPLDTPILYAAKRQFDGKRHVLTGWLRDLGGARNGGSYEWGGTQSIPRELYAEREELLSRPVAEIRSAFLSNAVDLLDSRTTVVASKSPQDKSVSIGLLQDRTPDDYRLLCELALKGEDSLTVRVRTRAADASGYSLEIVPKRGAAALKGPGMQFSRPLRFRDDGKLRIEAFIVGDTIEFFVDDAYAFSGRAYDFPTGGVNVRAVGAPIDLLRVFPLYAAPSDRARPELP